MTGGGFAMVAELPLGVYRGHVGGGDLDVVPSPARLHAALWCAAAQGVRAVTRGDQLTPCEQDLRGLEWVEANPPDGIRLPRYAISAEVGTAYRKEGQLVREQSRWVDKVGARPVGAAVAVDGPFAWTWQVQPPAEVRQSLEDLCRDVSHLGMAETPVRLRVAELAEVGEPTHLRDPDADLFTGAGLDLDVPQPGRGTALEQAYRATASRPPASKDRHSGSEETVRSPAVTAAVAPARYAPPAVEEPALPWVSVMLAAMDRPVKGDWRVGWCVAAHRALISLVGDGAPASLTGAYPDGTHRPANRVALQILDRTVGFAGMTDAPATLAVLVPRGLAATDLTVISTALGRLATIRRGKQALRLVGEPVLVPADRLWPAVPAGHTRRWRTATAFVPDTRPPRGAWSLADAAALSVGMVWRDLLGARGRGETFYRQLAADATARGVQANVERVTDGDPMRFVHKVNTGHMVAPLRATLSLGSLAGPRSVVALGQSRHLGGGLLVPVDEPGDVEPVPLFAAGGAAVRL